jgi:hypothetical protein
LIAHIGSDPVHQERHDLRLGRRNLLPSMHADKPPGSMPETTMAYGSRRFPAPWLADKIPGGYVNIARLPELLRKADREQADDYRILACLGCSDGG